MSRARSREAAGSAGRNKGETNRGEGRCKESQTGLAGGGLRHNPPSLFNCGEDVR